MSRIRTTLAAVAVAVIAGLGIAAPAAAHDAIVSSTPAADEVLTEAPAQITLTFSNDLLSLEENSGTAMIVQDEAGDDWVAGPPVVEGDTVTVPLLGGMRNGPYLVTWKVVSSDGHPTSGEYSFTLDAVDAPAIQPMPTEEPSVVATAPPMPTEQPATSTDDGQNWPLLIGLGVVVLAAVVVFIIILARKKR